MKRRLELLTKPRSPLIQRSPEFWMIRIDPGGEFKFAPGQYATLGVEGQQKRSERPYSIVSSPHESELEFFFELVPNGELTPQLYQLQLGDELLMRKVAKGRFTLDTRSGRTNHLLVCTVTGIAPFVSYVRTLYKDWKEGKFVDRFPG
jgi:ferredoxin--NADP+ reductase